MIPSDVLQIERCLGKNLPEDYRAFLIAYPTDAPADIRQFGLFDDPAAIVDQNFIFRRYLADDAACDRYIVIGDIGCGDRVCLDRESSTVFVWSHADEDFSPLATSIEDYYRIAVSEAL